MLPRIDADIPVPILSWSSVLVAFAVSLGIGVLAGGYPAHRAARLRPIEALRFDRGTASTEAEAPEASREGRWAGVTGSRAGYPLPGLPGHQPTGPVATSRPDRVATDTRERRATAGRPLRGQRGWPRAH